MKFFSFVLIIFFAFIAHAQNFQRRISLPKSQSVEIINRFGRVTVTTNSNAPDAQNAEAADGVTVNISSDKSLNDSEIKIESSDSKIRIEILATETKKRVDLNLIVPERIRVKIQTENGEAGISGNFETVEVKTETGTIAADVPLENLKYDFVWTESRPRFLSDVELEKIKEKSAGKFAVSGKIFDEEIVKRAKEKTAEAETGEQTEAENASQKKSNSKDNGRVSLDFTTARGIILLNVPASEVSSDLRERPLTEAAKAVIRSGDSLLMAAIRRTSPKYFGDYAKTLPPAKREPTLAERQNSATAPADIKKVLARVTDENNRAVADLKKEDFEVSEAGESREILSVEPTTAPFNLVLLLDVSGSVDNYVNFIRKAARNFVNTVEPTDKVAIIIFSDDVQVVSNFTTDKTQLSASLDTFDAGGATALYDALAYALSDTLRPLKGERTAIVALTDGDDNRSFLPFESLLGSIQESGALIYPLYVPSSLVGAAAGDFSKTVDPLRMRYMGLTTKAEGEGERLARVSGGVYYPISQLGEIQKAYDDIVVQLRTAYSITFRSNLPETADKTTASPRLKVRVKRANAFVKLGSVVAVSSNKVSEAKPKRSDESNTKKNKNTFPTGDEISGARFSLINAGYFSPQPQTFRNIINSGADFFFDAPIGEISGEVAKINYKQFVSDALRESKLENFDINRASGAFLLSDGKQQIAVSRWISPKRTRSYPYERVYDTLAHAGRKVAIIPVVKDEGLGGDRDFLQWDTVSLLSLLDVHVVLAYYSAAEKNSRRADQITAQKLDNNYVSARLTEIFNFKGTPRDWNERETKQLKFVLEKAKSSYAEISKNTKTYLHNADALDELIVFAETPQKFIEFSRRKSQSAQTREFLTDQPKEALSTDTKAKVTINNALFGKYFFTCDETKIENKTVYLIEAKHTTRGKMPSRNDIKDGFVKLMLYTNLSNVKVAGAPHKLKVQIRLTASRINGSTNSDAKDEEIDKFLSENTFDAADRNFIKKIFEEARANRFTIILEHAETAK